MLLLPRLSRGRWREGAAPTPSEGQNVAHNDDNSLQAGCTPPAVQ